MSVVSGFRKLHNCQHVLLNFKEALDFNEVFSDLYDAYDCLSLKLLILKLHEYCLDSKPCIMMANYFTDRKQYVKIDHIKGMWMDVVKDCLQRSLIEPLTYNVHSNDLLFLIMIAPFLVLVILFRK